MVPSSRPRTTRDSNAPNPSSSSAGEGFSQTARNSKRGRVQTVKAVIHQAGTISARFCSVLLPTKFALQVANIRILFVSPLSFRRAGVARGITGKFLERSFFLELRLCLGRRSGDPGLFWGRAIFVLFLGWSLVLHALFRSVMFNLSFFALDPPQLSAIFPRQSSL